MECQLQLFKARHVIGSWSYSLFKICCNIGCCRLLPSVNGEVKVMIFSTCVSFSLSVCLSVHMQSSQDTGSYSQSPVQGPSPHYRTSKFVQIGHRCAGTLPPPDMLKLVHYVVCTARQVLSYSLTFRVKRTLKGKNTKCLQGRYPSCV